MYLFIRRDYTVSPNISKTIRGADLKTFLNLCFERSQYFSLKTVSWASMASYDIRKKLEPFLVKQILADDWFGYSWSHLPLDPPAKPLEIQIYKATPETKEILLHFCEDIFMKVELNGNLDSSNQDLQDLCFISNNQLLVGTVTHEYILAVNTSDAAFIDAIKKLGDWTYEEDNSSFPFLDQEIIV